MTKKRKNEEVDLKFVDFIYDPIYGNVDITQIENEIIHTLKFLKLRGIKQLGLKSLVFPGALHTRFEHSIGTMEICDDYLSYLLEDYNPQRRQMIRLCGLLHDIGHGPFSHAIEDIIKARKEWTPTLDDVKEVFDRDDEKYKTINSPKEFKTHDDFSIFIIRAMPFKYTKKFKGKEFLFKEVAKILQGEVADNEKWKYEIIHGDIGADRIDYLSRDSHHTGISFGIVDIAQILRYLTLIDNSLHLGNKLDIDASYKEKISRTVGENILISRIHHYNMLVENPKAVGIEKVLYKCLYLYLEDIKDVKKIRKKISEIFLKWDDSYLIHEIENKMNNSENKFLKNYFPILTGEKELNVLYRYDVHSFRPNLRFWLFVLGKDYRNEIENKLEQSLKEEFGIEFPIVDLSYLSDIPKLRIDSVGGATRFFYDESNISQGAIKDRMRNLSLTIFSLKKQTDDNFPNLEDLIEKVISDCREKALKDKNKFVYRHVKLLDFLYKKINKLGHIDGIVDFYRDVEKDKELSKYYDFEEIGYPTKFPYSHALYSDLMRLNALDIIETKSKDIPYAYENMLDDTSYKKKKNEISSHSFEDRLIKWSFRWTISYYISFRDIKSTKNGKKVIKPRNEQKPEIEKILDQAKLKND